MGETEQICEECGAEIFEGDSVYCGYCFRKEPEEVVEYVYPEVDNCRRCGERKRLNEAGYCSAGCEMGFKPGEWWR